jgi:putative transposase
MPAKSKVLDTIWEIDDVLWAIIEPILLEYWPPKRTGRKPADWRRCINGIIYQMRSGCQWNKLPKRFGDDATVHRWFSRWSRDGVLEKIWAVLIEHCDELGDVEWKWQAADGRLGKARFGGPTSVPTRRIGRKTARNKTSWSMARGVRSPR